MLERELLKLIDFYLDNPNIEPCSILNQDIDGLALVDLDNPIRRSYCGAGVNMKAYDSKGDAYPCQFFLPLSIGIEKSNESKALHFYHDTIPEELIEEKCKKSVIQSLCPNCFGANYAATIPVQNSNTKNHTVPTDKALSIVRAMIESALFFISIIFSAV